MHAAAGRAGRGLLRGRRLGAAALVRVERRPARGVRRPGDAPRARVGRALVVADHQRRAPRDARDRPASSTCRRSRSSTSSAPARSTPCSASCVAQCDVPIGKVVYTPVLDAKGGFRSDLTVMRLATTASGSSPAARTAWSTEVVRRPDAGRRLGARGRPAPRRTPRSGCGARGPATSSARSPATTSATRASASAPAARSRSDSLYRARLADLLRRRARLGAVRADRAGRPAVVDCCTRRAQPHGAVPVGIGVYGTTGRIEKGYRAFGFELDAERTIVEAGHAAAEGEGGRLRRPGGLPQAARGGARGGAVHADRRRPHLGVAA